MLRGNSRKSGSSFLPEPSSLQQWLKSGQNWPGWLHEQLGGTWKSFESVPSAVQYFSAPFLPTDNIEGEARWRLIQKRTSQELFSAKCCEVFKGPQAQRPLSSVRSVGSFWVTMGTRKQRCEPVRGEPPKWII